MADVDNSAWDASKAWSNGANSDDPEAFYRGITAGEKTVGDPDTQEHWALPHHYHPGDAPNAAGVRNGLSRISQTDDLKDKAAAQKHLDGHMSVIQAQEKAATQKEQRASRGLPNGLARVPVFASHLRAALVQKDGKSFYEVEGYATVFNQPYVMYDIFGEYREQIASTALDESLGAKPDVAFLENHTGLTMARTTNGTLTLTKDERGLRIVALLNAERSDIRNLASAINDGLVTEMSFAFMIGEDGYQWNDDFDLVTLTKLDINRGDVSAVNYGANPYTNIGMRAAEIIRELRQLPAGAIPRAQEALSAALSAQYAAYGDKLGAIYRRAAQEASKAVMARVSSLREAGLSADEIKAEFPELDFSSWPIEDLTGEGEDASSGEFAKPDNSEADSRSASGMSTDLLAKRFNAIDI